MKTIVITGSTRGIGYGLADSFLALDCNIVISGRKRENVDQAVKRLAEKHPSAGVAGFPCDVRERAQVQKLWDEAIKRFGQVDIWINNAGISNAMAPAWALPQDDTEQVIQTNIIGAIQGSSVAITNMLKQGHGAVYNLEGLGSEKSQHINGMSLYAMTKAALRYYDDSLFQELKGKPVIAGAIQPGMVVTDLITAQSAGDEAQFKQVKWITNIIGNSVEEVAPWIAEKVLANTKNGARFRFMSGGKTMMRFLLAPFSKRDLFKESDGDSRDYSSESK